MNDGSINPTAAASPWRHVLAVAAVLGTTALAYGWSADDGLFFDDRWHQYALERARWSFDDLVASSTIEPAKFIHAWWQDKTVRWDYCRPVTMAWMKVVQTFSGGSASAQHFSALGWHGCC